MTLGEMKEEDYRLVAHCQNRDCGHGQALDIDLLIERFGPDYVIVGERRIGAACVCSACGHKGAAITINPHVTAEYANATGWGMPPR